MSKTIKFKVGDNIVNFGRVHKIFKIEKKKDHEGREKEYIYYKPHFEAVNGLVCSIPVEKISSADIRRPVSLEVLDELCDKCKQKVKIKEYPDANEMSTMYNTNDPENLIEVLRILTHEIKNKETGLSTSKKTIYDKALKNFAQEFAFVKKVELEKAEAEIMLALQ